MLSKVARTYFKDAVDDTQRRKALAFAIFLKNKNRTSVFKDWTLRGLAKDAGVAPGTAKKRLDVLREMKLIRYEQFNGHSYLVFKKIRKRKIKNIKNDRYHTPLHSDVSLEKVDMSSVASIEKHLMSLHIMERTARVEYTKRLISLATAPPPFTREKKVKKARAYWRKRGIENIPPFKEYGYSYRRIARELHCGPQTVKYIIALGESQEMFIAHKSELVLVKYIGGYSAKYALPYFKKDYPTAFATSNNIYIRPAMTFSLFDEIRIWD